MKNATLILLVIFLFAKSGFTQLDSCIFNTDSNTSFFDIRVAMNDYLDSLELVLDSSSFNAGNGEYRNFKKFEKFWAPRVSQNGRFGEYFESVEDFFYNSKLSYDYYVDDPWQEVGPNRNNYIGIGPTEFISFFDNGTETATRYMLTGSLLGGLFYSDDYGESWSPGGTDGWMRSGCSWAVFHPYNHNVWFASSSGNPKDG